MLLPLTSLQFGRLTLNAAAQSQYLDALDSMTEHAQIIVQIF